MKRIIILATISLMFVDAFSQVIDTVYPPLLQMYATGYLSSTQKVDGAITSGEQGFYKFDLTDIPNHATVTDVRMYYQMGYVSITWPVETIISEVDADPATATFAELQTAMTNATDTLSQDMSQDPENYGGELSWADFDPDGISRVNDYLPRDWIAVTLKFDEGEWGVIGYDVPTDQPYLVITYTPGTPVTDITFITTDTLIDTKSGTLQLAVDVTPASPNIDSITWKVNDVSLATIDANGLLTATGTANGTVVVTASAWDGSGVEQTYSVTITNQVTIGIEEGDAGFHVYPVPATDHIHLNMPDGSYQLSIYSLDGKQMKLKSIEGTESQINCSDLPGGIYLMRIFNNQKLVYKTELLIQ